RAARPRWTLGFRSSTATRTGIRPIAACPLSTSAFAAGPWSRAVFSPTRQNHPRAGLALQSDWDAAAKRILGHGLGSGRLYPDPPYHRSAQSKGHRLARRHHVLSHFTGRRAPDAEPNHPPAPRAAPHTSRPAG